MLGFLFAVALVALVFPYRLFARGLAFAMFGPQNWWLSRRNYAKMKNGLREDGVEGDEKKDAPATTLKNAEEPQTLSKRGGLLQRLRHNTTTDKEENSGIFLHIPRRNALDTSRFHDDANLMNHQA
jgi:hypothetical protein